MNTRMNRRAVSVFAGLVALALGGGLRAMALESSRKPLGNLEELTSNDGTYRVRYRLDPEVIEFGELFSVALEIERADGEPLAATLAVDARMPEHQHGMNREPLVESKGAGIYSVTNLYFHMPGYWEVYIDLTRGAVTERAQFPIDVD